LEWFRLTFCRCQVKNGGMILFGIREGGMDILDENNARGESEKLFQKEANG